MTMHIAHPALNTYTKKKSKGKIKYASAKHKKEALAAEAFEKEMYKKWGVQPTSVAKAFKEFVPLYAHRDSNKKVPSLEFTGGTCSKKEDKVYTGTLIKGIAAMHKSNAVPIINSEQAIEIARMRRG